MPKTCFSHTLLVVVIVGGLLSGFFAKPAAASAKQAPNIILVLADDVSARELSPYGGPLTRNSWKRFHQSGGKPIKVIKP
jgi:hypothetical protein